MEMGWWMVPACIQRWRLTLLSFFEGYFYYLDSLFFLFLLFLLLCLGAGDSGEERGWDGMGSSGAVLCYRQIVVWWWDLTWRWSVFLHLLFFPFFPFFPLFFLRWWVVIGTVILEEASSFFLLIITARSFEIYESYKTWNFDAQCEVPFFSLKLDWVTRLGSA